MSNSRPLQEGDILLFEPPIPPSMGDRFIQFAQRMRGIPNWQYVHAAVVTKGGIVPEISHMIGRGFDNNPLSITAYADYPYVILSTPSEELRSNISKRANEYEATAVKTSNDNVRTVKQESHYSPMKMIAAFFRGDSEASRLTRSMRKQQAESLRSTEKNEEICSSLVASIVKDAIKTTKDSGHDKNLSSTFLLPGNLCKNLEDIGFEKRQNNQLILKPLADKTQQFINRQTMKSKFLRGHHKEKCMKNIRLAKSVNLYLINDADPFSSLKDAIDFITKNKDASKTFKRELAQKLVATAEKSGIKLDKAQQKEIHDLLGKLDTSTISLKSLVTNIISETAKPKDKALLKEVSDAMSENTTPQQLADLLQEKGVSQSLINAINTERAKSNEPALPNAQTQAFNPEEQHNRRTSSFG